MIHKTNEPNFIVDIRLNDYIVRKERNKIDFY